VINAVDLLQEDANIDTVSAKLNRGKTVVYEYLKKLENWEIISSKRYELRKHYQINKLKIPRREIWMATMTERVLKAMNSQKNIRNIAISAHIDWI